jgi:hypothetical protein
MNRKGTEQGQELEQDDGTRCMSSVRSNRTHKNHSNASCKIIST